MADEPRTGLLAAAKDLLGGLLPISVHELAQEVGERLDQAPVRLNAFGYDPYGFHPESARRLFVPLALAYRHYFRAETYGIEKVPTGRVLLIANHGGQIPLDGAMLGVAMLLDAEPPRICRPMGEYFIWKLPWMSVAAARMGTMVGTPANCSRMLEEGECVMVFPEGARGINKPYSQAYQLEEFGMGFMRLALETETPIVPVGLVGPEEQQPGIANLKGVAKLLGTPSAPITLTFPLLGPLGLMVALPVKYHIYFGDPLHFDGDPSDEDVVIEGKVNVVKSAIQAMLDRGRAARRGIFR